MTSVVSRTPRSQTSRAGKPIGPSKPFHLPKLDHISPRVIPERARSDPTPRKSKRQSKKQSNLSAESRRPDTRRKISLTNATSTNGLTSAPARGTALRSTSSESQVGKPRKISQESLPSSTAAANLNSKSSLESDVSEAAAKMDESLRWDNVCSDPEQEAERIRIYKVNRRKRYLAESLRTRNDKESVLNFAKEIASSEDV